MTGVLFRLLLVWYWLVMSLAVAAVGFCMWMMLVGTPADPSESVGVFRARVGAIAVLVYVLGYAFARLPMWVAFGNRVRGLMIPKLVPDADAVNR